MKQGIKLTNHGKISVYLHEFGFGIFTEEPKVQEKLRVLKDRGRIKNFGLEMLDNGKINFSVDEAVFDELEDEDAEFISEIAEDIAYANVSVEILSHDDRHCENEGGPQKISDNDSYYLRVNLYYFDKVVSGERRRRILEEELSEKAEKHEESARKIKARDVRFIIVLNVLLAAACIVLTIYCYVNDLRKYGILMFVFALFFAVWGYKFKRVKTEQ